MCPIQITLQLETARLNDCSRNQAKQAAYRNNATRVFSENLERQTGGGHVIKPCGHVRSFQRQEVGFHVSDLPERFLS